VTIPKLDTNVQNLATKDRQSWFGKMAR